MYLLRVVHAHGVLQALKDPIPDAPLGFTMLRENDGDLTAVPDTSVLANRFGATKLVPARRGSIPNGPAAFSVHSTSTQDLRWLTRCVAQRTPGNVPIKGPGGLKFFQDELALGALMRTERYPAVYDALVSSLANAMLLVGHEPVSECFMRVTPPMQHILYGFLSFSPLFQDHKKRQPVPAGVNAN